MLVQVRPRADLPLLSRIARQKSYMKSPNYLRDQSFIFLGINWSIFFLLRNLHMADPSKPKQSINGLMYAAALFRSPVMASIAGLLLIVCMIPAGLLACSLLSIGIWAANSKGKVPSSHRIWSTFVSITLNLILLIIVVYTSMRQSINSLEAHPERASQQYIAQPRADDWMLK